MKSRPGFEAALVIGSLQFLSGRLSIDCTFLIGCRRSRRTVRRTPSLICDETPPFHRCKLSVMATKSTTIEVAGREVTVTNPDKVYFPEKRYTKLDLVRYYAAVAEGA